MVLGPWMLDPSLVYASEDVHRVCGSITPPPSWLCYQSSTLYAVIIPWDGSEFDSPMSISTFRHLRVASVFEHKRISPVIPRQMCASVEGRSRYIHAAWPPHFPRTERLS